MHHSGKIPIISKIISIKRDGIEIRYRKKELYMPFSDVHDIKLIKSKVVQNIIVLNLLVAALIVTPVLFYDSLDEPLTITAYGLMLLLLISFKSRKYEQAYFITIILNNGTNYKIKIQHKDRLDAIREITNYIDHRFKRSMQELFLERETAMNSSAS